MIENMFENDRHFVEWKEHFVSQERGNRVVHYFLKDFSAESILAVVGTERSVRHMFYLVSDDFVRFYGSDNSIHSFWLQMEVEERGCRLAHFNAF